jgi:hypothetical protein
MNEDEENRVKVFAAVDAVPARRYRRPTLLSALRQASKAGLPVKSAVSEPDGSIELKFGEPDAATEGNGLDKWIAKHGTH